MKVNPDTCKISLPLHCRRARGVCLQTGLLGFAELGDGDEAGRGGAGAVEGIFGKVTLVQDMAPKPLLK
jgi:hypothetical protein